MLKRARFLLFVSLIIATIAGAQTAAPTPAPPAPVAQLLDLHCRPSLQPELLQFCSNLTAFQSAVNQNGLEADPAVLNLLNLLNPAGRKNTDSVAVAVSVTLATKGIAAGAVQLADQVRSDIQTAAPTASVSGATSLVTKAGSAELLSLALDTGALTQSINGTTATVTTNADHLFRLLTGFNPDCVMNCSKKYGGQEGLFETRVLDPLNFAASFQLAQSDPQTTATSGQASGATTTNVASVAIPTGTGKLTAIGAKYEILNSFDPRKANFQTLWQTQVTATLGASAATLAKDVNAVYAILEKDSTFKAAASDLGFYDTLYNAARSDRSGKALVSAFQTLWTNDLKTALNDPTLPAAVATVIKDREDFREAWSAAVAQAAGSMLSLQYNYNQQLNQPKTHDFTVVAGYTWGVYGSLTFNGAVSIYQGSLPSSAQYGRVHFGQVSGEYDRNLSRPANPYQISFSLAGYWQYQPQPSVLDIPAGTVVPGTNIPLPNGTQEFVGTAGSLWVTQGKLTIKGPNGINIPLGVSWSNKTDLLQGSKVGGQVGLSYNFSTLAGLF